MVRPRAESVMVRRRHRRHLQQPVEIPAKSRHDCGGWWNCLHCLSVCAHDTVALPAAVANHSRERGSAMNTNVDPLNHIYTVELRFFGDGLNPAEITRRVRLSPTRSSGDLVGPNGRKLRPFWAYSGESEAGFQPNWPSLEQGLDFLLGQLAPFRESLIELSEDHQGIFWCGHFQSSFDGGPMLSPRVMANIASYRLPLFIDNYFSEE